MKINNSLKLCIRKLNNKSVIAYPTESVFGLGCDPDSKSAVYKLLKLKKRPLYKGLILVASNYNQLLPYIKKDEISEKQLKLMFSFWPGHTSFVVPVSCKTPKWLTGNFNSIAIRISDNINIKNICHNFGKPIVSTSANLCGLLPCRTVQEVKNSFGKNFPVLEGNTDNRINPSEIRSILNGKIKIIRRG